MLLENINNHILVVSKADPITLYENATVLYKLTPYVWIIRNNSNLYIQYHRTATLINENDKLYKHAATIDFATMRYSKYHKKHNLFVFINKIDGEYHINYYCYENGVVYINKTHEITVPIGTIIATSTNTKYNSECATHIIIIAQCENKRTHFILNINQNNVLNYYHVGFGRDLTHFQLKDRAYALSKDPNYLKIYDIHADIITHSKEMKFVCQYDGYVISELGNDIMVNGKLANGIVFKPCKYATTKSARN